MNTYKAAPEAMKAMTALGAYVNHASGLETTLLGLVQMRASMINGCAYCIDISTRGRIQTALTCVTARCRSGSEFFVCDSLRPARISIYT